MLHPMNGTGDGTGREISAQHVAEISAADSSDYWWYAVRQMHVEKTLRAATSGSWSYLDLGCGAGGVLRSVQASLAPRQALGLDGTQEAVDVAVSRGLPARYADFRQALGLPFVPDAVTCLDVLEHLEDPVLALQNLAAEVSGATSLVVTVPAHPFLWSAWDEACGHFRRYTRATLREHLEAGGWRVERARYFFSYCVPPAWWDRRVRKKVQEMEFPPVSALMNGALAAAGRAERLFGCPMPFGTSLIASARRTPRG